MEGIDTRALTLAESGRYSPSAILACALFVINPEPYTVRVRERATLRPLEVEREVAITSVLPGDAVEPATTPPPEVVSGALISPAGSTELDNRIPGNVERFPFPYLIPKKGELLTIHDLRVNGGSRPIHFSHAVHSSVAKLMIQEMLYTVGNVWLALDRKDAIPKLRQLEEGLTRIPDQDVATARRTIGEYFSSDGRLRDWNISPRHDQEQGLHALCLLLAERNIVVTEVMGALGEPFEITYTELTDYSPGYGRGTDGYYDSLRQRIVRFLGSHPSNIHLWVPLAAISPDYHFFMAAPAGYYFARQLASPYDAQKAPGGDIQLDGFPRLEHMRDGRPRFQTRPGPTTEAHILVVDADKGDSAVDIGLSLNEIPLGSAWPALLACLASTLLMALLLLAKHLSHGTLGTGAAAALLVAFVSNSISAVAYVFSRNGIVAAARSRLILLGCAFCGNLFAVWWLFNRFAPPYGFWPTHILKSWGGYAILVATSALAAVALHRVIRVIRVYDNTYRRG